jgi:Tfp pilus assembly protein PilV
MFQISQKKILTNGFSVVEIVVAVALLLLIVSSLYTANIFYLKTILSNVNKVKASFLAEEGVEAVKLIRDQSWANISGLTVGNSYYLYWNGSMWQATTTNTYVQEVFERKFVISNVNRDSNSDIVTSGGSVDAGTKKVAVSVSWLAGTSTSTKSISTYITNFVQ